LRQALADVNDGDTIDATEVSGTITLTSGQLLVDKSGNATSRLFKTATGETVSISGLTVAGVLATPKPGEGGSPAKVQIIAADTAASTGKWCKEEVNVLTREAAERHGKSSLLLPRTHDRNYFYSTVRQRHNQRNPPPCQR
jgi:hypothetical protein